MTITQSSARAIINWQSYNVGSGNAVIYQQPGSQSVALNRIVGNTPSQIDGRISANGQLVFINPNGVVFGNGARVDAAALSVTTHDTTDASFMAGAPAYIGQEQPGAILFNQGTINVEHGGIVQLSAGQISNSGSIAAPGGSVILDSGSNGTTLNSGTIDVSDTASMGQGGTVQLLGNRIGMLDGSFIDARGTDGGGTIEAGGSASGTGPLPDASALFMANGAIIDASAIGQGNGGHIVTWGTNSNQSDGTLRAQGGELGGNGGLIETSGHWLDVTGATISASALLGRAGTWLLDPTTLNIVSSGSNNPPPTTAPGTWQPASGPTNLLNTTVNTLLNAGTSVTLDTTAGSGGDGSINVYAAISKTTSTGSPTLQFNATGLINISGSQGGSISSTGPLTLVMNTTGGLSLTGQIALSDPGSSASFNAGSGGIGSNTTISAGSLSFATSGAGITTAALSSNGSGGLSLTSNGGNIQTTGLLSNSGSGNILLNSGGGNISTAAITQAGSGTLTLQTSNGGSINASGTVQNAAGSGAMTISQGNTNITSSIVGKVTNNSSNAPLILNTTGTGSINLTGPTQPGPGGLQMSTSNGNIFTGQITLTGGSGLSANANGLASAGSGNIVVNGNISKTDSATSSLALSASGYIQVSNNIVSSAGPLNVTLSAKGNMASTATLGSTHIGAIALNPNVSIKTLGGSVAITGTQSIAPGSAGGWVSAGFSAGSNSSIDTSTPGGTSNATITINGIYNGPATSNAGNTWVVLGIDQVGAFSLSSDSNISLTGQVLPALTGSFFWARGIQVEGGAMTLTTKAAGATATLTGGVNNTASPSAGVVFGSGAVVFSGTATGLITDTPASAANIAIQSYGQPLTDNAGSVTLLAQPNHAMVWGGSGTNSGSGTLTLQTSGSGAISTGTLTNTGSGGITLIQGDANITDGLANLVVNNSSNPASGTTFQTTGKGNIVLTSPASTGKGILNLIASGSGSITVNSPAASASSGLGYITFNGNISTTSGSITFSNANNSAGILLNGLNAQNITTQGGAINFAGDVIIANPSGLNIGSNGGAISFAGKVDSGDSYSYVPTPVTQSTALTQASSGSGNNPGDTWLATSGSALVNGILVGTLGNNETWLAGQRIPVAGTIWSWIAGPSQYAFYNQSSRTALNGSYINWSPGEPNGNGALGENQLILLPSGKWNDLPASATAGYIKETALAPAPLTLNAGSGTLTVASSLGSLRPLGALNINAGSINVNGGINTTGTLTMTATASNNGNLTLGGTINTTQGSDNLSTVYGNLITGSINSNGGNLLLAACTRCSAANALTATGGAVTVSGTLNPGTGNLTIYTANLSNFTNPAAVYGGFSSGSGSFRYNTAYGTAGADIDTSVGDGKHYILYRAQPSLVLNASGSKMYGSADPSPTLTIVSGQANGDTVPMLFSNLSTLTRASYGTPAGEQAGQRYSYALTSNANRLGYALTLQGSLSITPKALSIQAQSMEKVYGNDDPVLNQLKVQGLVQNTTVDGVLINDTPGTVVTGNMGRAPGETVGSYALTAGTLGVLGGNYSFSPSAFTSAPFSITQAPAITVNANDQNIVYGNSDPTLSYSVTGLINKTVKSYGLTGQIVPTALTDTVANSLVNGLTRANGGTLAGEQAGSYTIGRGNLALSASAAQNYAGLTFNAGTLTLAPARLTVTALGQNKMYGANDPGFVVGNPLAARVQGIVSTTVSSLDPSGILTPITLNDTVGTVLTGSLGRALGETVGGYAITSGNVTLINTQNYTFDASSGFTSATFSITQAPAISIQPNSPSTPYGTNDPALTYSVSGLINATVQSVDPNGRPITSTVNDTAANSLTGGLGRAQGGTLPGERVNRYAIGQGNLTLSSQAALNYAGLTVQPGAMLSITQAPLTVIAQAQNKTYGESDPSFAVGNPQAASVTGIINTTVNSINANGATVPVVLSDTVATVLTGNLGRASNESPGPYTLTDTGLTLVNAQDYSFNPVSGFTPALFTIHQAPAILVQPASPTIVYGTSDPALTYSVSGLINTTVQSYNPNGVLGPVNINDTSATALTGQLGRTQGGTPQGELANTSYPITQGSLKLTAAAALNYIGLNLGSASLGIQPTNWSVVAPTGLNKVYGNDDPALAPTSISGVMQNVSVNTWTAGGDTQAVTLNDTVTGHLGRAQGEAVGQYAILLGSLSAGGNYNTPSLNTAMLAITSAPMTVSADAASVAYGAPINPAGFSYNPSGLVNRTVQVWGTNGTQETVSIADTQASVMSGSLSTTATAASDAGQYPITQGSLAPNANYALTLFTPATLFITKASATVDIYVPDNAKVIGDTDPDLALTNADVVGLANGQTASQLVSAGTLVMPRVTRTSGEVAGNYAITATGGGATDYNLSIIYSNPAQQSSTFTIVPTGQLLLKAANATVVYGNTPTSQAAALSYARYSLPAGNSYQVVDMLPSLTMSGGTGNVSDSQGSSASFTLSSPYTAGNGVGAQPVNISNIAINSPGGNITGAASPISGILTVTPRPITLQAATISQGYSGTNLVNNGLESLSPTVASDLATGDSIDSASVGFTFTDKNAGNGNKTVTGVLPASGLILANGSDVTGDYLISTNGSGPYAGQAVNTTSSITPKSVTLANVSADNKTYDTTSNATLNLANAGYDSEAPGTGNSSDGKVYSGDALLLSSSGARFVSPNAGSSVAIMNTSIASGNANYVIAPITTLSATITPAPLTLTGLVAQNKVYDATSGATLSYAGSNLSGVLDNDEVTLNNTRANAGFADPDVGNNKPVTVTGLALSGSAAANYSLQTVTGLSANITPAPLTPTGLVAQNKVYDTTTRATLSDAGSSLIGVLGNDTVSLDTAGATASFADPDVGNNKPVNVSGLALTGMAAANYTLQAQAPLSASITPAPLTLTGVVAQNKVYDATSGATLNYAGSNLLGVLFNDKVALNNTSANAGFADPNAGNNKPVTVTGLALSGNAAGNYSLQTVTGLSANITPAPLTPTGLVAQNKVYDTTTRATLSDAGSSLIGVLGNDTVSLDTAGATASFADPDVGNNKPVSVSGLALTGMAAANYTLQAQAPLSASITPAPLTLTGVVAQNKVYDATLGATLNYAGSTLSGVLGNDEVGLNNTRANAGFADPDVGNNKPVTVTGLTLSGNAAANYSLQTVTGLSANITPAPLTLTGVVAQNKVYDATLGATLSYAGANLTGVQGNDTVSLDAAGATARFADPNAGNNKPVNVSGLALTGMAAADYTLQALAPLSASITPAPLSLTGVVAQNKVYDTTPDATLSYAGSNLSGVLGLDEVGLNNAGASARFANPDVGSNLPVTVTGLGLSGNAAGNYSLQTVTGLSANITPAPLTLTGVVAQNKVYDTTPSATLSYAESSLTGVLVNDTVSLDAAGATARFADPDVGNSKPVSVSGLALSGSAAGNYMLQAVTGLSAGITPKSVTLANVTANNKTYDASTVATLNLSAASYGTVAPGSGNADDGDVYTGDTLTLGSSARFSTQNAGANIAITASITSGNGNYTIAPLSGLNANITPKPLTIGDLSASDKTYDQTATANLIIAADSLQGGASNASDGKFYQGDQVSILGGVGTFADASVASGKRVTITQIALGGADSGNYTAILPTQPLSASISPAPLTLSGLSANDKLFDGTTAATLSGTATLSGALPGEDVTLAATPAPEGQFLNANVGQNIPVKVDLSALSLSGAQAGNYVIQRLTSPLYATIYASNTQLGISGIVVAAKPFDFTTSAALGNPGELSGLPYAGALTLDTSGVTASFTTRLPGTHQPVLVSGYSLLDGVLQASDYTLPPQPVLAYGTIFLNSDPAILGRLPNPGAAASAALGGVTAAFGNGSGGSSFATHIAGGSNWGNSEKWVQDGTQVGWEVTPQALILSPEMQSIMKRPIK